MKDILFVAFATVAGYLLGVLTANGEASIGLAIVCFIAALAVAGLYYVIKRITR